MRSENPSTMLSGVSVAADFARHLHMCFMHSRGGSVEVALRLPCCCPRQVPDLAAIGDGHIIGLGVPSGDAERNLVTGSGKPRIYEGLKGT